MKKHQHQTSKITTQGLAANAPNDSGKSTTHPQICQALHVLFPKCFLPQKKLHILKLTSTVYTYLNATLHNVYFVQYDAPVLFMTLYPIK